MTTVTAEQIATARWTRIAPATPDTVTASLTASLGAETPIVAPQPGAPAQSLLRAATIIEHGAGDYRWANGVEFSPESCADANVFDPCATGAAGVYTGTRNRPVVVVYQPFIVDAYDACSTFGWQAADYEARARRLLAKTESEAIAKELWLGTKIPSNPQLAAGVAVTTVGTALAPENGLSLMVQALADANAGVGMIHVRPRMLQIMVQEGWLRYESGKWLTSMGNIVVADAGYPGTGPLDQAIAANTEWIFGTELVEVHRGPIEVFTAPLTYESVDHSNNNVVIRAQRMAAPLFNGCALLAASITVPITE